MKLPLCAWCGESMTERARRKRPDGSMMMLDHPREPHRPRYGWHGDCAKADDLCFLAGDRRRDLPTGELVTKIRARGEGRVVTRSRR